MKLGAKLLSVLIIVSLIIMIFPMFRITWVSADLNDESALNIHGTIHINGNSQFNKTNGVVAGSGKKSDPYIIENLSIDATSNHGIKIENSDSYFIIRNCYVFNGTNGSSNNYGVYFYNVTNGVIKNCRIKNNLYGLYFNRVFKNKIINNSIEEHQYRGIYIAYSNYNEIFSNTISLCYQEGLYLYTSDNNLIFNNTVSHNNKNGLLLEYSINNLLFNNTFLNNTYNLGIKGLNIDHFTHQIFSNNTVEGKPIYYWLDQTNKLVPEDAGFVGLVNCSNITVCNLSLDSNQNGILIFSTSNSTIKNNEVFNNSDGISIYNSTNLMIINNTCYQNDYLGIGLAGSTFNHVINNNCTENKWYGIAIGESDNNTIKNNTCTYHEIYGIYIIRSENNTVTNNNCMFNSRGICLAYSKRNNISNSNCCLNSIAGIELAVSDYNYIFKNNFSSNKMSSGKSVTVGFGIFLYMSSNNIILQNNCSSNVEGIFLKNICNNNSILNNTCSFCRYGIVNYGDSNFNIISNNTCESNSMGAISIVTSYSNTISNNICNYNQDGILLYTSDYNTISNNNCSSIQNGILIEESKSNNISDNNFTKCGLMIFGNLLEHWNTHTIESTNKVNDKPVYYCKNQLGGVLPNWAGQVILANCSNVTITNHNLSQGSVGLIIAFTSNSVVTNITSNSNGYYGTYLYNSYNNILINITCNSNEKDGIHLDNTYNNSILNCTCNLNSENGISLANSINNTIYNSIFHNNSLSGISVGGKYNSIENNSCCSNIISGISISGEFNRVNYNNCSLNNNNSYSYGIYIRSLKNSIISNNTCNQNQGIDNGYGIYIYFSNNNIIANNTCNSNSGKYYGFGIWCSESNSNNFTDNNCSYNDDGIYTAGESNTFINNSFLDNYQAIRLTYSKNNILIRNKMINCGIMIQATHRDNWNTHTITASNTVNSKPVQYLKNQANVKVPTGAGQIILANCNGIRVENQYIINATAGILIGYTDNSIISNSTISNQKIYGIYLLGKNNKIINNTIINNSEYGCYIYGTNNELQNNSFINNSIFGLYFHLSTGHLIYNNIFINNSWGLYLKSYSNNNKIYNNFFSNPTNYFENHSSGNTWNIKRTIGTNIIGGPYLGGNFWSDYNGSDTDGDGLGNTKIPYGPGDNLPLCKPYDITSPTLSDMTTATPTTGELFSINVETSDFGCVEKVYIEYWCDQGKPANETMDRISGNNRSGIYLKNIVIPNDAKLLRYKISAKDLKGNWKGTEVNIKNIVDNDKPNIEDRSGTPKTGEDLKFVSSVIDNIAVSKVYVEYWINDIPYSNITFEKEGNFYNSTIFIPSNAKTLKYLISAVDDSNNWASLESNVVQVMDNEKPEIFDLCSDIIKNGENFTFEFQITDNIELSMVYLEYWFDTGAHYNVTISNDHKYKIKIPSEAFVLYAIVTARDTSDNIEQIIIQKGIIDEILPVIKFLSTEKPRTGEEYAIKWSITENRLLKKVILEYGFKENDFKIVSMNSLGGVYDYKVDVPTNARTLQYKVKVEDDTGTLSISDYALVNDIIQPQIFDNTEGIPTGGEDFEIRAYAEDNIEVDSIYLEYWFDDNAHMNINFDGKYLISIPNSAVILHYKLNVIDMNNNSAMVEKNLQIKMKVPDIDMEKPTIKDFSPKTATTGDFFNISATIRDNIYLSNITIEYWFDSDYTKKDMEFVGDIYSLSLQVPEDASEFVYIITAKDSSNNTRTLKRIIAIDDNDNPIIIDYSLITDSGYKFIVEVQDNIGISDVYVNYILDPGKVNRISLQLKEEKYTSTISIPDNAQYLYYSISAVDTTGNWVKTETTEIEFKKEIEPEKIDPLSTSDDTMIWTTGILVITLIIILFTLVGYYLKLKRREKL